MPDTKENIEVGAIASQYIDHPADEALRAVKQGRASQVDIAALILAENIDAGTQAEWTPEEDKKLIQKVDWRLIPIVCRKKSISILRANTYVNDSYLFVQHSRD